MTVRLCHQCDAVLPANREAYCNRLCRSLWRRDRFLAARNIGYTWHGAAMLVNAAEGEEAVKADEGLR